MGESSPADDDKLDALTRLAAAIAHDLNNAVATILGNTSFLGGFEVDAPNYARHIEQIERAANLLATLSDTLSMYAAKGSPEEGASDVPSIIREGVCIPEDGAATSVRVSLDLADNCPPVRVPETTLAVAVSDLVANARLALSESGGDIHVKAEPIQIDPSTVPQDTGGSPLPAGNYVRISIADSGEGIAPETQARIFEPAYTTRIRGKGYGLSRVLGITRSYGGAVTIHTAPGRGTRVDLTLPVATPE